MSSASSTPAKVDNSGPAARDGALAFIIDDESSIRQFISLILQGNGIDTIEFVDGASFREVNAQLPHLVFLNVNLESQDAVTSLEALSKSGFTGAVQLMSNRGSAVLDTVKQAGEQMRIHMLPVLKKPFETAAIHKIMTELKLGHGSIPGGVKISLAEALKHNWVEFWYQPKVDLRRKQLVGAEAFARVCHPDHGVMRPGTFMLGADEAATVNLAEKALVSALQSGINLSKFGVNLRIAINVPVNCLTKLPVGEIVRHHRPQKDNWPGLVIDVPEQQIVNEIKLATDLSRKLAEYNVHLAIDDFGKAYAALTRLKELPFVEMKLDRSFVSGCGTDKVHAPLCKTVIDLAHGFGARAVGIGLEKASDTMALISMGCDIGQGFLFGEPMPEQRFIALLKQRVMVRPASAATAPQLAPA